MRRLHCPTALAGWIGGRRLLFGLLTVLAAPGCAKPPNAPPSAPGPPTVQLIHPEVRKIIRVVGQPSFVESYERTSIYPKVTGYIEKWVVDIGDKVKEGDVLATLFVPELREDWETKKATVKYDKKRVDLAEQMVEVAKPDVKSAEEHLTEARKLLAAYKAEVDRWDSEVKRLKREEERKVVAPQVVLESQNQLKSDTAKWDAQKATVAKADADLLSKKATLAANIIDVGVAKTRLLVAESEARRLEAWVGYLTLPAPYDGVVVARNVNKFDFVMPLTGDPTAERNAPHLSPSGKAAPLYVVDRIDIVRVFVDIPEEDANYVQVGTKATVLIRAYRDKLIPANVTRTAWALNVKSRTLRAEIDLPNPGSQILPGMYAYGKVIIEHPNVQALPLTALAYSGDKTFIWRYERGHAVRTEVETGVSDDEWIEVTNRRVSSKAHGEEGWVPIDGSEQVITGDLSVLADGQPVKAAPPAAGAKGTGAKPSGEQPETHRGQAGKAKSAEATKR